MLENLFGEDGGGGGDCKSTIAIDKLMLIVPHRQVRTSAPPPLQNRPRSLHRQEMRLVYVVCRIKGQLGEIGPTSLITSN